MVRKLSFRSPSVRKNWWHDFWNFTMHDRCSTGFNIGTPVVFFIYVNDICQFVENQNCNVFADDTILNSFGTDVDEVNFSLQLALNSVENWYSSHLLSLSREKSATLLVRGNKRNEPGDLNVTLAGHPLKQERSMKYLGSYLDQNLFGMNNVTSFVCTLQKN